VKLPSGGDLKSALKRGPVELEPEGVYPGFSLEGEPLRKLLVDLRGNGATIRGAVKLTNCAGVVTDLFIRDSPFHGMFLVQCRGFEFTRLLVENAAKNGILSTALSQARFIDCGASRNALHGIYISESGAGNTIRGGAYTDNGKCGAHLNAAPHQARDYRVEGADLRGNRTASIQAASVVGGVLADNLVGGGRFDVILWTDSQGKAHACREWDCTQQPGRYQVSRWCKDIQLPPGVVAKRPQPDR
jgi:hypothetical protein